jgi:multidrug efflux pump subunit AcrA (membrane-fusion protein)
MRRAIQSFLAILILLAVFAAGFRYLQTGRPHPARRPPRELGPVPVLVRELHPRALRVEIEGFGTLRPRREAILAPEVGGTVVRLLEPWRVGEAVTEGTLLLALDPELLDQEIHVAEAAVEAARARLEAAEVETRYAASGLLLAEESVELYRREEERLRSLSNSLDVSKSRLEAATRARTLAAVESDQARGRDALAKVQLRIGTQRIAEAEAHLALARERRCRAEISVPFDGVLKDVGPAMGSHLRPGVPVAHLADTSVLRSLIPVAEENIARLAIGGSVTLDLPSKPGESFEGKIVGLGIEADPRLRTVPVEVEVDGAGSGLLRPGNFVRARLMVREVEGALVLSRDEFLWLEGQPTAFVCVLSGERENGRVEARDLELGARVEGGYMVESGLSAGELLITEPLGRLSGGETCNRRDGE